MKPDYLTQAEALSLLLEARSLHEHALLAYYNPTNKFHARDLSETFDRLADVMAGINGARLQRRAIAEREAISDFE